MEHSWDEVREKWFTNQVFDSLDGVEDRLVEALAALERDQKLVASTTGFDWIINCSLTATYYEKTVFGLRQERRVADQVQSRARRRRFVPVVRFRHG